MAFKYCLLNTHFLRFSDIMKVILSLADVNQLKLCPICGALYPHDYNFCPHEEEAVELLEIEVIP